MTIVTRTEMAEILGRTEAEVAALEAEGAPVLTADVLPGLTLRRYDSARFIEWYVARNLRRRLAH